MTNFSQLKKLDVTNETTELKLYAIEGEPVITVAPATQANSQYFNAILRQSGKQVRELKAGAPISTATLDKNRDQDRALFPKYVVKGWDGVMDAEGAVVPFTEDNVRDFLEALPDWLMDEIRNFASETRNFLEDVMDAEELSKN